MSAGVRNNGESHLPAGWSRSAQPSAKFFRLSHLRRLKGVRTGGGSLLPGARQRHRIPAGADPRQTLDFSQRQRRARINPRPGRRPRGFRRSGSAWPDGGSFVYAVCAPQGCGHFRFQIFPAIWRQRIGRQRASLRGHAARIAARVRSQSYLVFCPASQAAFARGPQARLRRRTRARGRPRRDSHPALAPRQRDAAR